MPKRLYGTRRVETPEVQGEGSYVVLRPLRRGDARLQSLLETARGGGMAGKEMEVNDDFIKHCVTEWNWVGDDGQELPLPGEDPAVLENMPTAEYQFLVGAITDALMGTLKNSKTASKPTSGRGAKRRQ